MSTNYYVGTVRNPEKEHIGKFAFGWVFSFNGRRLKTVAEWRDRIANLGVKEAIYDDTGSRVEPDEFWKIVASTKLHSHIPYSFSKTKKNWIDEGYDFSNYAFC